VPAIHLTIFRKGLLLVGLPMLIQLAFLIFLFHVQNETRNAEQWAIHTRDVMEQTRVIYRRAIDTMARTQGALINGDVKFGSHIPSVRQQVDQDVDQLVSMVSDNEQVERARKLGANADALLNWCISQSKLLESGQSRTLASAESRRGGEEMIATLGAQLDNMLADEERLDRERLARVTLLGKLAYEFLIGAAVGSVVVAGAALWLFSSSIAGRLNVLAGNANRLADRRTLAPPVGGHDEISTVDQAFHAAASRLTDADVVERNYRQQLEQRSTALAELNTGLTRVNEELRFKTQENETFVYSVSHDLRSPLVNLQGFSKELARSCEDLRTATLNPSVPPAQQKQLVELVDGEIMESIRFIQTAVSRSSNIIDSLLRLSRAGRVEYKRQRTELRPILERIVGSLQSSLRERGAQITLASELPDVDAEPSALEQIFGNLLTNAVNYLSPDRPGRIEAGATSSDDPNSVRYFVRDNGLGIPTAYLPKLFVAFQRLHGQVAPGEGIGLALVRRVVERLGGNVSVESTEGMGSTFYVTLPKPIESAGASASPVAAESV
jgi:signal transduction histidine kinase